MDNINIASDMQLHIGNREKTVIGLIKHLSDTELFGLECYLAGSRAGIKNIEQKKRE